MKQLKKLTLTLVALLSMATGAWAQSTDPNEVSLTEETKGKEWTFKMPANNVELQVEYEPEFTATFVAGNANTIQGGKATVTESEATEGTQVTLDENGKLTPLYEGQTVTLTAATGYKFRKVEVKKGAAGKTITIGDMELTYADGDTWETIVSKNSDKIKTLSGRYIVQVAQPAPDTYTYIHVWYTAVKPSDIIDPSKNYQWSTLEVAY